ncbi:MAG: hypothetical protein J6Y91_05125 [Alphaproteobacteria bacterium]|nr:hypothetical protein [Alphaproteobacteria bacterium]
MTTTALIASVLALFGNVAVVYLPFDNKKKVMLGGIVAFVLMGFIVSQNAYTGEIPVMLRDKIAQTQNPEAKELMMAHFNVAEEQLHTEAGLQTPIELSVGILLVLALVMTPVLLKIVSDSEEAEKVHSWLLSLNILAGMSLLSLFCGLDMPVMPFWRKNTQQESANDLAVLQKETVLS